MIPCILAWFCCRRCLNTAVIMCQLVYGVVTVSLFTITMGMYTCIRVLYIDERAWNTICLCAVNSHWFLWYVDLLFSSPPQALAIKTADHHGCPIILANDPDADRLAVAEKQADGSWRVFNGNETGFFLSWWALHNYKRTHPHFDGMWYTGTHALHSYTCTYTFGSLSSFLGGQSPAGIPGSCHVYVSVPSYMYM